MGEGTRIDKRKLAFQNQETLPVLCLKFRGNTGRAADNGAPHSMDACDGPMAVLSNHDTGKHVRSNVGTILAI